MPEPLDDEPTLSHRAEELPAAKTYPELEEPPEYWISANAVKAPSEPASPPKQAGDQLRRPKAVGVAIATVAALVLACGGVLAGMKLSASDKSASPATPAAVRSQADVSRETDASSETTHGSASSDIPSAPSPQRSSGDSSDTVSPAAETPSTSKPADSTASTRTPTVTTTRTAVAWPANAGTECGDDQYGERGIITRSDVRLRKGDKTSCAFLGQVADQVHATEGSSSHVSFSLYNAYRAEHYESLDPHVSVSCDLSDGLWTCAINPGPAAAIAYVK